MVPRKQDTIKDLWGEEGQDVVVFWDKVEDGLKTAEIAQGVMVGRGATGALVTHKGWNRVVQQEGRDGTSPSP